MLVHVHVSVLMMLSRVRTLPRLPHSNPIAMLERSSERAITQGNYVRDVHRLAHCAFRVAEN